MLRPAGGQVRHEVLEPVLDEVEAGFALARWLESIEAEGPAEAVSGSLLFFPFWQVEGRRLLPATAALVDGLDSVALPSGSRRTFDPASAAALGEVLEPGPPPGGAALSLLHLPFHELAFAVRGRPGRAWVCAVTGQVLPDAAPPSRERRLDAVYAGFLGGLLLALAVGFRLLFAGGWLTLPGLALLFGLGLLGPRLGRDVMRRAESR